MKEVWQAIYGAAFTIAFCWAMGSSLLERLNVRLAALERHLVGFVTGAACLSLYIFLLCLAGQARRGVVQWSGAVVIGLAVWRLQSAAPAKRLPSASRSWMALFLVIFTVFLVVYFFNALAPESSADGSGYHLGNVSRWAEAHGFVWAHHNMYSYLSQGMEMLFLVAFLLGKHSAAAMVHLAFLAALGWLLVCFGRRTGHPRAGLFAAIVMYASPVVGLDASVAYNDVALSTVLLVIVYLLEVYDEINSKNLLIIIGVLCGYAYGIKYTAGAVIPFAFGWAVWRRRRGAALLAAGVAISAGPWVLRNWIWLGNPAAPFLNHWFPNPYYHPGMEQIYTGGLRQYQDLQHWWQVPWELTMRGGAGVTGFLGPVLLLAPVALLALRFPLGRRLLLAGAVTGLPALLNTGTRFLIPPLPFVALAMGLAMERSPGVLPALALFQAVLAWPSIMPAYAHQYSWRIGSIPWAAALRETPPGEFLARRIGEFPLFRTIEAQVPPHGRVFSFAGRPEAYIHREILVSYESAEANLINDILLAPLHGYKPVARQRFRFPMQGLSAARLVQGAAGKSFWSVAEVRVFAGERELPRRAEWRLSSHPNPWEVQLAFDNSPVTRWQSWEAMRPGQSIEIRFGRTETADSVVVESAAEGESRLRLEGQGSDGAWQELSRRPEVSDVPPPRGMRRAAALEVKARGIGWLLVNDNESAGEDMRKYRPYWGVTELGEAGGTHFYRID